MPPAALAIHLSIGQAYAFSVFNLPLSQLVGIRLGAGRLEAQHDRLGVQRRDRVSRTVGRRVRRVARARRARERRCSSPRSASAADFKIAALGVATHQFWLLLLGYGVLGGIGLGLGYISPVSTLIKWFPDRPGHGDREWRSWASAAAR